MNTNIYVVDERLNIATLWCNIWSLISSREKRKYFKNEKINLQLTAKVKKQKSANWGKGRESDIPEWKLYTRKSLQTCKLNRRITIKNIFQTLPEIFSTCMAFFSEDNVNEQLGSSWSWLTEVSINWTEI